MSGSENSPVTMSGNCDQEKGAPIAGTHREPLVSLSFLWLVVKIIVILLFLNSKVFVLYQNF